MSSNSEAQLRSDVRGRSAAVKRDIQCACDAAFLRLRDKERQLLRVVDLVAGRQQGDLWAASLLRQQQQQRGGIQPPLPPLQTMSLALDTDLLHSAIQRFASVRLDGLVTSSAQVTSSSLPDGLEEYGAEEHLVSHKPLPAIPGMVRVTRPPSLVGYDQSYSSSLTSGDECEKFELVDSMYPEKIFRSDPIDIDKDRCGRPARRAAPDIENLHLMDCVSPANCSPQPGPHCEGRAGPAAGETLTAAVPHPLAECRDAWLLSVNDRDENRTVPSPLAQWEAAMSSSALFTPARCRPPTTAPTSASTTSEKQRWLLRQACRANEPCQTPADCVSDCATLALEDGRSQWLLGSGRGGGSGGDFGGFTGAISFYARGACGGGLAAEADEGMEETRPGQTGTVPDLLAPFRQLENTTAWVAAGC